MRRQLAAVGPPAGGAYLTFGGVLLLGRDLVRCRFLFGVLQRKLQLVLRQALRPSAEAMGAGTPG